MIEWLFHIAIEGIAKIEVEFNEGSREKTAGMLGVSIATLYRKMGLKVEREKADLSTVT